MRTSSAFRVIGLYAPILLAVAAPFGPGSERAHAATVSLTSHKEGGETVSDVVFQAAPGERNDVTARALQYGDGPVIHDGGAFLVATAPCRAIDDHTVDCSKGVADLGFTRFELGDLDDRFQTVSPHEEEGSDALGDFIVYGGPGHDTLTAGTGYPALNGDEGNDSLLLTDDVLDGSLDGGTGDDELWGGRTSAALNGGGGRDAMHGGELMRDGDREGAVGDAGPGPDLFDATLRPGLVQVSYADRRAPLHVDLRRGTGGQVGEGDVLKGVRTVAGGRGDDRLLGDDNRNVLTGGPGFDRLAGRGGDDELNPNRGGSRLHCGAGMDEVVATSHKDRLAIDCESLGDNTRARPTPAAAGTLHYRADCEKRSDDESLVVGECSARLLVRRTGGRRAVLAAGAIPLHRWHTTTLSLELTRAGQRLAARRGAVTAALTLREHENGRTNVRRWSTRVVLQR